MLLDHFWKFHLTAEELLVSQKDRAPESLDLSPGIIYVVLALHPMASGFQYAGKSVTHCSSSPMPHMQGAGGVGTDELHLYRAAVPEMRPAIIMAQAVYFVQDLEPCGRTNHQVYEPGTGNFHPGKITISVRQLFNERGSDISRRALVRFGEI